ncbi:MAG: amino acid permease [Actinomycetota bacterium]
MTSREPSLARRLTTTDAVVIGLGSMIGAGVFAAVGPAAAVAGSWLLAGLILAGVVAFANATSSAELAAVYPESGGTYVWLCSPCLDFAARRSNWWCRSPRGGVSGLGSPAAVRSRSRQAA